MDAINQTVKDRGYAFLTQAQKDIYNQNQPVPVTPTQTNLITSTDLTTPIKPITIPPVPAQTIPDVSGVNANIAGNTAALTPAVDNTGIPDWAKMIAPPPSIQDQYNADYASAGISGKQADVNAKNQEVLNAKAKLDAVNAQLQGITAEGQAIPIQQQQDATGRGITAGGLAPLTSAALRNNALKAIPVQTQALVAQAEMAAAQGNAQLSQNILDQANNHLDKVFQIHQQDAQNLYNYNKDIRDKAYQYASDKQKEQIAAVNRIEDKKFAIKQDAINNQQALSRLAIDNNQGSLAAQIAALNPDSPTYNKDIATLQGKIHKELVAKPLEAPTVKTINGVDMQWNSKTGAWENIGPGQNGALPENIRKSQDNTNLVMQTIKNLENPEISGASGRSTGRQVFQQVVGIGPGDYGDLISLTNTLRTSMLVMQADPSIKKFFGPQMSNADVQLMTAAGTTLNPEMQSPELLRQEVARIKDLTIRANMATQGVTQYAKTPSGVRVGLFPDGTIKDFDGNLYNADGKKI